MAGHKTWAIGEEVIAGDFNPFIADQIVAVYATAAARAADWPAPPVGALTYRTDAGVYESWNGSAWVAAIPGPPIPVYDYTPTLAGLAIDVNDGASVGRYMRVGQWVLGNVFIYLGTNPSVGSYIDVGLPVPARSFTGTWKLTVGDAVYQDVSNGMGFSGILEAQNPGATVARCMANTVLTASPGAVFMVKCDNAAPFAFAGSDFITATLFYEAA